LAGGGRGRPESSPERARPEMETAVLAPILSTPGSIEWMRRCTGSRRFFWWRRRGAGQSVAAAVWWSCHGGRRWGSPSLVGLQVKKEKGGERKRERGGWVVAVVQGIIIEKIREGSRWPWHRWSSRLPRDCGRCPSLTSKGKRKRES
jgi:hypothetical protein